MKRLMIGIVMAAALGACGKSAEERAKEDMAREHANDKPAEPATPPPAVKKDVPAEAAKEAKPPEPEPTTPAEIEHARNQAMIDGRDKDVLKYCEMGKLDDKSNPQALLGCTLAACRLKDEATAKKYGTPIKGPLKDQAKKVCLTNQIGL